MVSDWFHHWNSNGGCLGTIYWKIIGASMDNLTGSVLHKLKGLTRGQCDEIAPRGAILVGYRGSVAHGTYTPTYDKSEHDDKDIMGVFLGPLEHYLGLTQVKTQEKMIRGKDGVLWDSVFYELRKFISLLLKSNPNVMSLLWLPEHLYIHVSPIGQKLIDNRDIFASKQAYHSYSGYAYSQLKRMTHVNSSDLGAKRKELVARFGFDTKNAGHLIRLLREGIEFLTDGEIHVVREDASELKEIKNGEWTLEAVVTQATRLFDLAQKAYINSPLPPKPDFHKAEGLLAGILAEHLRIEVS